MKRRRPANSVVTDIEDRNDYIRTMTSGFDRKFIDEHGLKQGIYNLYSRAVEQGEYRCAEEKCTDELLILESRIIAAIDTDGEIYKLTQLQPELMSILIDTNKRVVICMKHKAAAGFLAGEQKSKEKAKVIPFMRIANGNHIDPRTPKKPR